MYGVPVPGTDGRCGMSAIVLKSGIQPTSGMLTIIIKQTCKVSLFSVDYCNDTKISFVDFVCLMGDRLDFVCLMGKKSLLCVPYGR